MILFWHNKGFRVSDFKNNELQKKLSEKITKKVMQE